MSGGNLRKMIENEHASHIKTTDSSRTFIDLREEVSEFFY